VVDEMSLAVFCLKFENQYLRADGDRFQELFATVMERAHRDDFVRVQPWGKKGDMKCDGFLNSERKVFACYGPKEFSPMARALKKIGDDHHGALKNWKKYLSAWTFVHNEHRGLPPEILQLLLDLQTADDEVDVGHWGLPELTEKVRTLSLPDLVELFGAVPTARQLRGLRQEDLQAVLPSLLGALTVTEPQDLRPVPPEKLDYNRLSEHSRLLLLSGMQVSDRVQAFFERWEPGVGDKIAAAFNQRYLLLRSKNGLSPDEILWELHEFAGGASGTASVREQVAVFALLAYMFEACEIFDRPPAKTTP